MATAGTDYINTAWAEEQSWDRSEEVGTEKTFTINADGLAVLQSWFGDATNNGIIIRISETAGGYAVGSSENATTDYRPKLTIVYTGVTIPQRKTLLGVGI